MGDHAVPDITCPECHYVANRCAGVATESRPVPGDLSLCIACAAIAVFDDELRLRRPTEEERAWAENDAYVRFTRAAIERINQKQEEEQNPLDDIR